MIWKTHPKFKNYEVSKNGEVRHKDSKKIRKFRLDKNGYHRINIFYDGKINTVLAHRLVYETFLGERPDGMTINHKDLNKINNCVSNLELITASENTTHGFRNGASKQCRPITIMGQRYYSLRDAERETKISRYKLSKMG